MSDDDEHWKIQNIPQVHDPDLHKSVDGTAAFSVLRPAKKNVEQGFKMTCTP